MSRFWKALTERLQTATDGVWRFRKEDRERAVTRVTSL